MITGKDFYEVLVALVPLYVAMFLAYASLRWWKIFNPVQCEGIGRYVSIYAIPFLSFHIIASSNPYNMNLLFIAADTLHKVIILAGFGLWLAFAKPGSILDLDWSIALFTISTLPNTLVMGVPLLGAMYGVDLAGPLMVQVVMFQVVVWNNLLLVFLEYRDAKAFIADQFPAGVQARSIRVDPDVESLGRGEADIQVLEEEEVTDGGGRMISAVIRRSTSIASRDSMEMMYSRRSSSSSSRKIADVGLMMANGGGNCSPSKFKQVGNKNGTDRTTRATTVDLTTQASRKAEVNVELTVVDGARSLERKVQRTEVQEEEGDPPMPSKMIIKKLILTMVWRKLIRNPITYASLIGLIWSLISFRWGIKMPRIIEDSISIIHNTGLGMAMFSLGIFMALQPKIIACRKSAAAFVMVVKFLLAPALMAGTSAVLGIRGVHLRVAIVQAALPAGITSFVFAKDYKCHADILSTSVIFGMIISLPVTIVYYIILGLL